MIEFITLLAYALTISTITMAVARLQALLMAQVELQAARPSAPGSSLIFPRVDIGVKEALGLNKLVGLWTQTVCRIASAGVPEQAVKSGSLAERVFASKSGVRLLDGVYGAT